MAEKVYDLEVLGYKFYVKQDEAGKLYMTNLIHRDEDAIIIYDQDFKEEYNNFPLELLLGDPNDPDGKNTEAMMMPVLDISILNGTNYKAREKKLIIDQMTEIKTMLAFFNLQIQLLNMYLPVEDFKDYSYENKSTFYIDESKNKSAYTYLSLLNNTFTKYPYNKVNHITTYLNAIDNASLILEDENLKLFRSGKKDKDGLSDFVKCVLEMCAEIDSGYILDINKLENYYNSLKERFNNEISKYSFENLNLESGKKVISFYDLFKEKLDQSDMDNVKSRYLDMTDEEFNNSSVSVELKFLGYKFTHITDQEGRVSLSNFFDLKDEDFCIGEHQSNDFLTTPMRLIQNAGKFSKEEIDEFIISSDFKTKEELEQLIMEETNKRCDIIFKKYEKPGYREKYGEALQKVCFQILALYFYLPREEIDEYRYENANSIIISEDNNFLYDYLLIMKYTLDYYNHEDLVLIFDMLINLRKNISINMSGHQKSFNSPRIMRNRKSVFSEFIKSFSTEKDSKTILNKEKLKQYCSALGYTFKGEINSVPKNADKVYSKNKKSRPNDPCPCGSGKKYKKCCKNK